MMYNGQRMKAVRTPLATALFIVVATLYGCGPFFGPSGGPQAPTFDPPAGAYTEEQWIEVSSRTGRVYATTDPDASALEFEPLKEDRIYVPDDMTIRAFVLDDSGLRSAIVAAEYTIDSDDVTAPTISDTSIIQGGIDNVVLPAGAKRVAAKAKELGQTVELKMFDKYGHAYYPKEYMPLTLKFFNRFTRSKK